MLLLVLWYDVPGAGQDFYFNDADQQNKCKKKVWSYFLLICTNRTVGYACQDARKFLRITRRT